jgi:hypothetical protein
MKSNFILLAMLVGCGQDATKTDYKMAGVGLNPEDISAEPTLHGGFASYDYVEFSGAALPLGLTGLLSFDGIGPNSSFFAPPYAMVIGSGFVFLQNTPAPDALFGSFGVPPEQIGRCHTVYSPTSYLSGLADVGMAIDFSSSDGSGFTIGRRPLYYPPDVSQVFPYYTDLSVYRETPRYWRNPGEDGPESLQNWEKTVATRSNYPFGQPTTFSFPGTVPDDSANFGSIPMPYSSETETSGTNYHFLPNLPLGVMLSWDGPLYSGDGLVLSDGTGGVSEGGVSVHNRCLTFQGPEDPESPVDCIGEFELPEPIGEEYPRGQMYTAPWETANGVTVSWMPSASSIGETFSISVRFLGKVDEIGRGFVNEVVSIDKNAQIESAWNSNVGAGIIPDSECPEKGFRPALPCDENVEFEFDEALRKDDGYVASLQGDPTMTLAEVTCNIDQTQGSFVITNDILKDALTYAKQHNAQGAIFYVSRTTKTEATIPDAMDYLGNRRSLNSMLISSNAVQMGRFWFTGLDNVQVD